MLAPFWAWSMRLWVWVALCLGFYLIVGVLVCVIILAPSWALGEQIAEVLLAPTPLLGFALLKHLGSTGNELAWNARHWRSAEEFNRVQRNWSLAGNLIIIGIVLVLAALSICR